MGFYPSRVFSVRALRETYIIHKASRHLDKSLFLQFSQKYGAKELLFVKKETTISCFFDQIIQSCLKLENEKIFFGKKRMTNRNEALCNKWMQSEFAPKINFDPIWDMEKKMLFKGPRQTYTSWQ